MCGVCPGMYEYARVCVHNDVWVCFDVCGCAQVCVCVQVFADTHVCAQVCAGVCGMNIQNTYCRLES